MKKRLIYILAGFIMVISLSCEDYLTVQPEGFIPADQNFKNEDDAITSIFGLYGLMQPLVDQIFLAGEAQGDLVVAARGADQYISEITQNRVSALNPYTDYTNFYKLIVACNNTMVGLEKILHLDPVNYTVERYNYNLAEVMYIRVWAYMQIVKIWGDAPYIDFSVTSIEQLKDIAAMKSSDILAKIETDALRYYPIMLTATPTSTSIGGGTISGTEMRIFRAQFNNFAAQCLLTEIYVYQGNYAKAKDVINTLFPFGNSSNGSSGFGGMAGFADDRWEWLFISYIGGDNIDSRAMYIDFDGSKGQTNSLMRWTNNNAQNGGIYALKPSSFALKNWKEAPHALQQYQMKGDGYYTDPAKHVSHDVYPILNADGSPVIGNYGDVIRGEGVSFMPSGKDTLIFKYLIKKRGIIKDQQQNDNNSKNDAQFIVYRDGPMYLLACEIYNHLGLSHQALAILNGGFNSYPGTRYNVKLAPLELDPNGGDIVKQVDMLILKEKALEAGFEGLRWFDLVRMAKTYSDPSILANLVAQKYPVSKQAAMITRLSDPNYWYFPYHQRNVDANKLLKQKPGY